MVNEWSVMVHTILASSPARNRTIWTHGIQIVFNIQLQVLSLKIVDVHPPYDQYY